jgi:hypothetical protein
VKRCSGICLLVGTSGKGLGRSLTLEPVGPFYFNQSQHVSVEELGSPASGDDIVGWDGSLGIVRCCDLQFQSDPACLPRISHPGTKVRWRCDVAASCAHQVGYMYTHTYIYKYIYIWIGILDKTHIHIHDGSCTENRFWSSPIVSVACRIIVGSTGN